MHCTPAASSRSRNAGSLNRATATTSIVGREAERDGQRDLAGRAGDEDAVAAQGHGVTDSAGRGGRVETRAGGKPGRERRDELVVGELARRLLHLGHGCGRRRRRRPRGRVWLLAARTGRTEPARRCGDRLRPARPVRTRRPHASRARTRGGRPATARNTPRHCCRRRLRRAPGSLPGARRYASRQISRSCSGVRSSSSRMPISFADARSTAPLAPTSARNSCTVPSRQAWL